MSRVIEERFWEKVDRKSADECWLWTSTKQQSGYGQFWIDGRYKPATHVAVFLNSGNWPREGFFVCHICDNPSCVNPSHLFVALPKENTRDMYLKGRANPPRGERQPHSKLNEKKVSEIRARYARGERQRALATEFGVSQTNISRIVRNLHWPPA